MSSLATSRLASPRLLLALITALLLAMVASCSSRSSEVGTGPAGNKGTTATTADGRSPGVKFSDCMRSNGVAQFPDPDASGRLTIDGIANDTSIDPDSPAFKQALGVCHDLEPAGFTGSTRTASQQDDALAFAHCIRDHGVKDFPDPTPDSPLVNTNEIPSSNTEDGMTILNAAMKTCGKFVAGLVGGK